MNTLLVYTLQASAPAQGQPSALPTLIMFAAIILVMWLFMIRPQRKQQKELQNFRAGLKKGDKVVTVGGIYGESWKSTKRPPSSGWTVTSSSAWTSRAW